MKKFLFALLHTIGVTRFAAWYHRHRVVFLCYHGVTRQPTRHTNDPTGLHVNEKRFAAQLDFLQRHYHVISLSDYINARRDGVRLQPYSAVLTFDDGFRNFLTVAAPLLTTRRMTATVFLITDQASEQTDPALSREWTPKDDEQHLSWSDALILKDEMNFEMGSHTCSHAGLLSLSAAETERELQHSQNKLRNILGVVTPTLSYPKGQYSSILANDARKLGYACAVTTDRGLNEQDHDLFTLGRALIGDNDDLASLAVRVSGLRWWLVRLRSLIPITARTSQRPVAVPAAAEGPTQVYSTDILLPGK